MRYNMILSKRPKALFYDSDFFENLKNFQGFRSFSLWVFAAETLRSANKTYSAC